MAKESVIVDLEDVDQEPFPESGLLHPKLTQRLECTELRVNAITLEPGQATAPHSRERQEAVYVVLDGGYVQIGESITDVASGGVVRIGPDHSGASATKALTHRKRGYCSDRRPLELLRISASTLCRMSKRSQGRTDIEPLQSDPPDKL